MAKYKEETARLYTRAETIIVNNPLPSTGLNPSLRFNEELACIHEDGTVTSQGSTDGWVVEELTSDNLNEQFNLVDADDNVTGTATFADVHAMLRSLYKYSSVKRDNAPAPNDPAVDLPEDWPTMNIDQPEPEPAPDGEE